MTENTGFTIVPITNMKTNIVIHSNGKQYELSEIMEMRDALNVLIKELRGDE